jgi:hypothetical protein
MVKQNIKNPGEPPSRARPDFIYFVLFLLPIADVIKNDSALHVFFTVTASILFCFLFAFLLTYPLAVILFY